MNAGNSEGEKSMTKRRNGESRPKTGGGEAFGDTTDGHERDEDFSTPARWTGCSREWNRR